MDLQRRTEGGRTEHNAGRTLFGGGAVHMSSGGAHAASRRRPMLDRCRVRALAYVLLGTGLLLASETVQADEGAWRRGSPTLGQQLEFSSAGVGTATLTDCTWDQLEANSGECLDQWFISRNWNSSNVSRRECTESGQDFCIELQVREEPLGGGGLEDNNAVLLYQYLALPEPSDGPSDDWIGGWKLSAETRCELVNEAGESFGSCFESPEGIKEPFATSPAFLEVYCSDPTAQNYVRPDIADYHVGMYRELKRHEIEFYIPAGSDLCRPDPVGEGKPYIGLVLRLWNDPDAVWDEQCDPDDPSSCLWRRVTLQSLRLEPLAYHADEWRTGLKDYEYLSSIGDAGTGNRPVAGAAVSYTHLTLPTNREV